ncbi:MAG: tRNA (adenosine(37)-N6)-dimethylallyltransferase MiaA [Elainellaceae cyanobacterium]
MAIRVSTEEDARQQRSPGLVVICGPTASGKSSLAFQLSSRLNSSILSADSRQVYRRFDIGTAKATVQERQLVPHYLIDICEPTKVFTLADYQRLSQSIVAQHHQDSITPLLVGGTGLYIRSVVRGLKIPRVAPQPTLRAQLAQLGQSQCYGMLQQVDPQSAREIHPNDQVRTLRSLEVLYVTGLPMSCQKGECPPGYPILQIGLDSGDLRQRIQRRTQQMIEAGLVEEVAEIYKIYGAGLPLLKTLGYAEVMEHLNGTVTIDDAAQRIVEHTRQFAKRQRTWFRGDKTVEWFDIDKPDVLDQVWQRISQVLSIG